MIIYYDINMQLNRTPGHLCESTIGKEYIGQGKVTNIYISDKLQYKDTSLDHCKGQSRQCRGLHIPLIQKDLS